MFRSDRYYEKKLTLLEDGTKLVGCTAVGTDIHRTDTVFGDCEVHECVNLLRNTIRVLLANHEGVTKCCCLGVGVFGESREEVDHVAFCDLLAYGLIRGQFLNNQSALTYRRFSDEQTNVSMLSGSKPSQPI